MKPRRFPSLLLLPTLLGLAAPAWAAGTPDCGPSAPGQTVLAVFNPLAGAYCVSSFGSSDAYFAAGANGNAPYPTVYNPAADLFSGDDAVNLRFSIGGAQQGGSGWLTPWLDAGTLAPGGYATNSFWSVVSPIHYTSNGVTSSATSTIALSLATGTVRVTIATSIAASGHVTQIYTIQNNTTASLDGLTFADYYNFHPNGSEPAATQLGTTRFNTDRIVTTGDASASSFISNGSMRLVDAVTGQTLTPTAHDVGCADPLLLAFECTGTTATLVNVETGALNNADGPLGPGDYAGALAYSIGTLAAGQTTRIGLVKEVDVPPVSDVPELPQAWQMLAGLAGLLVLGIGRLARTARQ